jgi:hypothetical protein
MQFYKGIFLAKQNSSEILSSISGVIVRVGEKPSLLLSLFLVNYTSSSHVYRWYTYAKQRVYISRVYISVQQLILNCQVEKWQQKYTGTTEEMW